MSHVQHSPAIMCLTSNLKSRQATYFTDVSPLCLPASSRRALEDTLQELSRQLQRSPTQLR